MSLEDELKKKVEEELEKKQSSMPDFDLSKSSQPTEPIKPLDIPAEALGAKGYVPPSPNVNVPSGDSLPKKGGLPTQSPMEQGNQEAPATKENVGNDGGMVPPTRRESAPDIGKDYGSSAPPATSSTPTGEQQPPVGNVPPQQASSGSSLPKEEGLKKKEDSEKKQEGVDPSQKPDVKGDSPKTDSPSVNPEAPNPNLDQVSKKDDSSKGSKKQESPKKEEANSSQTGNGYGALKNGKKSSSAFNMLSNVRQNLAHNRRMKQGEGNDSSGSGSGNSNNSQNEAKPSLGSRLREGLNKLRNAKNGKGKGKTEASAKGKIAKKALEFMMTHPFVFVIIGIVILILLMLLVSEFEASNKKGGTHCTYNLNGVSSTGTVELSGLQVELINCDGTESNYTVLETVDFEKYVLGVALAEIGPDSPDEAIKTQIIAARNFALTRNSGMCPGNQDNCFYGYNASTGKIRMRACEADQVYWDYDKDIYRQDRGNISLYSPEITSGTLWKSALSQSRKEQVLQLAEEVKGKVLVDSSDNVVTTGYVASTSSQFISLANEGKSYEEILSTVYTDSDGFGDSHCSTYGNIDYGDYVLSSDGDEILHQPLDSFLSSNGTSLEEFNDLIYENVEKAGYGTRAGVVAAAVTLIAELGNNYNVKVPYYWGGGHYDGVVDGALGYWGSTQCHTYANGQSYNYCGLDCSGFVPWAIKNGGFNIAQMLAGDFQNLSGAQRVSLRNEAVLELGDLLESSGHIVLVVGVEDGNYICAEASGNAAGVLFTRRAFNSSGYWGVKMDGFYDTHVRSQ